MNQQPPLHQRDFPSPYLYQNPSWQDFWLTTKDTKHECYEISASSVNLTLKGLVYSYPWHFNQQIMHLPTGPFIESIKGEVDLEELKELLVLYFAKVSSIAREKHILSLTVDLDPYITYLFKNEENFDFIAWLKSKSDYNIGIPVSSNKHLLFEKVALINIEELKLNAEYDINKDTIDSLTDFFETNANFWLNWGETTRKQTRNSLKQDLVINTEKTPENIDTFYDIVSKTAVRQKFSIQSKDYFSDLVKHESSHLLIVKDADMKVSNVWVGIETSTTLVNLFGGNMLDTKVKNGNNFSHLYGIYMAKKLNKNFYDLGGYDSKSTTAKFKDGYKPQLTSFGGHFDLVYLPWYYKIIEIGITGKKVLKK